MKIDVHLLLTKHFVVALHLVVVKTHAFVVPQLKKVVPDTVGFFPQCFGKRECFAQLSSEVQVVGVGAISGIPQDTKHLGTRNVFLDCLRRLRQIKVKRTCLTDRLLSGHRIKQFCVGLKAGYDSSAVNLVVVSWSVKQTSVAFMTD